MNGAKVVEVSWEDVVGVRETEPSPEAIEQHRCFRVTCGRLHTVTDDVLVLVTDSTTLEGVCDWCILPRRLVTKITLANRRKRLTWAEVRRMIP